MEDGTARLDAALLGLDGFVVLMVTQVELAQRSQVSVATIRQLQSGSTEPKRRHPRTLRALSEALQWSPDH